MQVIVNISLKEGVLDPQGRAISHSLNDLGFNEVINVKVGKQILLEIDENDPARLRQRVARMCETLLSNTVIEDYWIEIPDEQ
ncbi:phosphoribosylformylglycinamidine synthase subunit PurS [Candidatus Puniceispirillum sp.]|jgi:phosphoribosylformylglycinamidine synthase PurS subunit|nr:phosphoribosylformylglycinamidine synthase subunit PurS [Candidatus Puniceispirillum sp.]